MEVCMNCLESRLREAIKRNEEVALKWHKPDRDTRCQTGYVTSKGITCKNFSTLKIEVVK